MHNQKPFFSIVIPTRDRPDLIQGLIWSILEQTFSNLELIICDNSNNDLTQEVINTFQDNRIRNIRTGNLSMSENYNVGINHSIGEYLMCISDKGFLKQGALNYLYELIKNEKHQCITWALDNFVYPGHFSSTATTQKESKLINSSDILRFMLGADYRNYEYAPMHCTSCISMELVNNIRAKHKNLCQAQNPDYTMAAQILLATKQIYNLQNNLAILRNVSMKDGYGTGHSLAKKTQESKNFLKDHAAWIQDTNRFIDVPIKDCPFIIDLMLKDTYTVFEDNNVNPDIFLDKQERLVAYYFFAYEEIIWRRSLGVDMSPESKIWLEAFNQETSIIKDEVNQRLKELKIRNVLSFLKYFVKNNKVALIILKIYRKARYRNKGIMYNNLEDCFKAVLIEEYKN